MDLLQVGTTIRGYETLPDELFIDEKLVWLKRGS